MNFDEKCFNLAVRVPRGRVTTYGEIARALKCNGWRAVGNAMRRNKKIGIVPCHRVVRSDGKVGGFVRGSDEKIKMLKEEGVKIANSKIDLKRYFFGF